MHVTTQLDAKYALLTPFRWYRFLSVKTIDNRAIVISELEINFADHKCEVRVYMFSCSMFYFACV